MLRNAFFAILAAALGYLGYQYWPPSQSHVLANLRSELSSLECARFDVFFNDGVALVKGYVGRPLDVDKAAALAQAVRGVNRVETDLQSLSWPLCEVAELVDVRNDTIAPQRLPSVKPVGGTHTLTIGENVIFQAVASDSAGFLNVDFFNAAGDVFHLMPGLVEKNGLVEARTLMRLGDTRRGHPPITINYPTGAQMLLAYTTSERVRPTDGPLIQRAEDYLPLLRAALDPSGVDDRVVAAYQIVTVSGVGMRRTPPAGAFVGAAAIEGSVAIDTDLSGGLGGGGALDDDLSSGLGGGGALDDDLSSGLGGGGALDDDLNSGLGGGGAID